MPTVPVGLYEQLITHTLRQSLSEWDPRLLQSEVLTAAEAADRIALHLGTLVRRAIAGFVDEARVGRGVKLADDIVALLSAAGDAVALEDGLRLPAEMLRVITRFQPDGSLASIPAPATPLLDTALLTNAPGEPRIGHQLQTEIGSADRIDVLMAFVRRSGLRPLFDGLQLHVNAGRPLRLLTTTYTGSTELEALCELHKLGAEVRVSYDTSTTRLHAKAWLFHRNSGFSTAFIGSSNLTHSAQISGLEWNLRVSGVRNPDVIDKFSSVFESYWCSDDFVAFDEAEYRERTRAQSSGPMIHLSPIEIHLHPFQQRLLEQIQLARQQGRHRNLLVAATGTGKTVMAAVDYQQLRAQLPRARLLFVAHRQEILEQSLATFRHALRDAAFGELWAGGQRPDRFEHVFASIQSLHHADLAHLPPDHFDVVIIDEFHHAAAATYRRLLEHLQPKELLGLTATPERGDDQSILHWFDDRIAAELRLWDAIDQQRLVPFAYYGISDGLDLRHLTWTRGRGYELAQLEQLVTGNDVLARQVIDNLRRYVPNPDVMRALGFCVSVDHARFMAAQFNHAGIAAVAVSAQTPAQERRHALQELAAGRLRIVFAVDLFNEGIDLPTVDTLLMLRPTDSSTVFLQQLGRGLRRHKDKALCTVLDFVGQHRSEFQLYRRFSALLGGTRQQLVRQVESGFPYLPSGCHLQLDPVAAREVLRSLRESLPSTWRAKTGELCRHLAAGGAPELGAFLRESGLALEDIYSKQGHCWSSLLEAAGQPLLPPGPEEAALRRGLGRLLHLNDPCRIHQYQQFLQSPQPPAVYAMDLRARRLFHMLVVVLFETIRLDEDALDAVAHQLWRHPQILAELRQLLEVLSAQIDHLQSPLPALPEVPLRVHARYTRREVLAAFAEGQRLKLAEWREGVRWLPDAGVDLLAITFDKSGQRFSPTTRYRDYAVSPSLLHWESQSGTRADSPTGRRYQQHQQAGSLVLPLARLTPDERAFWLLGPASYRRHTGERPMAITWQLAVPLPGDLFTRFAAAVA